MKKVFVPPRYALDCETSSAVSLPSVGTVRYAKHPTTQVKILVVKDLQQGKIHRAVGEVEIAEIMKDILHDLMTGKETMLAHNAFFDSVVLYYFCKRWFDAEFKNIEPHIVYNAWDTLDFARVRNDLVVKGKSGSLANLAEFYLKDTKKDTVGKKITELVCELTTCEKTANARLKSLDKLVHGGRVSRVKVGSETYFQLTGTLPRELEYCEQDVKVLVSLYDKIHLFNDRDRNLYLGNYAEFFKLESMLTNKMNFLGTKLDRDRLIQTQKLGERYSIIATEQHIPITGYKPTQSQRNIDWITPILQKAKVPTEFNKKTGKRGYSTQAKSLRKYIVQMGDGFDDYKKKFLKIMNLKDSTWKRVNNGLKVLGEDDILYNGLVHHGATATGRWTGSGFQLQNIPRPAYKKDELEDYLKKDVNSYSFNELRKVLKSNLRPCVVPRPGHKFFIADYAQIELRMSLYLTGQFEELRKLVHEDLYSEFGTPLFPGKAVVKDTEERTVAKNIILAGQFGASANRFYDMYIETTGELPPICMHTAHSVFNERFPAFSEAHKHHHDLLMGAVPNGRLVLPLMSGRNLVFDKLSINIEPDPKTGELRKVIKSGNRVLYGALVFQNRVQANSKDILAIKSIAFSNISPDYSPRFLVHDENVSELPEAACEATAIKDWNQAGNDVIHKLWPDFPLDSEIKFMQYYYK